MWIVSFFALLTRSISLISASCAVRDGLRTCFADSFRKDKIIIAFGANYRIILLTLLTVGNKLITSIAFAIVEDQRRLTLITCSISAVGAVIILIFT